MTPELLHQLTSRDGLLAIGVMLVMVGIILRGFASNARRELARRKQHLLDDRKSSEADLNRQMELPPGWLKQHFGLVANTVLIAGLVITVVAFFRH